MTIWFDVEDLFEYARANARPSGIQRLSYEVYAAAQAVHGAGIGFVRHDPMAGTMRIVPWSDVQALHAAMTARADAMRAPSRRPPDGPAPLMTGRLAGLPVLGPALRRTTGRLPNELRRPLGEAVRAQIMALRSLGRAAAAIPGVAAARLGRGPQDAGAADAAMPDAGRDLREAAAAGDSLVALGSPWSHPDYGRLAVKLKREASLRFGMLVYDVIPLVRPEFCDRGLVALFSAFMRDCLPAADGLLAISAATAADTEAWAAGAGLPICGRPQVIPIGTGFAHTAPAETLPAGLAPGGYVLFVSTIETRKNHALAFRAWRRLLDELGPERVPTLVFVGRVGWMVADLMQQIENAAYLGGRLVLAENADDATLAALYRGARFTLFPSFYEGWGLPVSESLAFGKVCLASNSTSIPEAGGPFCLYHDPDSVTDAVQLYRRAVTEPDLIAGLEARIARDYQPTPWTSTARAVLDAFG